MMRFKILGLSIPLWVLLSATIVVGLLITGIVIASVDIIQQHNFGYTKIGESRSVVVLQSVNGSVLKNTLNISTACNGTHIPTLTRMLEDGEI